MTNQLKAPAAPGTANGGGPGSGVQATYRHVGEHRCSKTSTNGATCSSFGAARTGIFRGGGSADANAARTVRRSLTAVRLRSLG